MLRAHGATGVTVVQEDPDDPGGILCAELWERVVDGERYIAKLTWQSSDQTLAEDEVRRILEALFIVPMIDTVVRRGGQWLG